MNEQNPRFFVMGERSILIEWEPKIDENLLDFILFVKKNIQKEGVEQIVEITHTYSSLLIQYHSTIKNIYDEILTLKSTISQLSPSKKPKKTLYHLPVCYDPKFGWDLEELSSENNLNFSEIQTLHSAPVYTIYFMGFLPGFLYLGGLEKKLFLDRKKQPRKRIEKGAVGIGGKQTGIYPKASPGGWQIIGSCPVGFFDPNENPPSVFRSGDKIKFHPISLKEHREISEEIKRGVFQLQSESYD